ncbi:hypothetical protein AOX55_00006729 (plasmid) [Sinorhizobium fredii CCBAU 25509]|nr:hypothetical protein AOX55_00006729 [Sinorhizobium fredii CCBAU 25509]
MHCVQVREEFLDRDVDYTGSRYACAHDQSAADDDNDIVSKA